MDAPAPVPVLLERNEVAKRLHVSLRTVRRYGRDGLLKNVPIGRGRTVLVTEESVAALISAGVREAV